MFRALLLEKTEAGFHAGIQTLADDRLPEGDVLVQIAHSTLNYKDGLAITNKGPVVRSWPMVAGIDGAGVVLESAHPDWKAGELVIHNGWGVGETRWGCLAERARLSGEGLVALPAAFSTQQAMAIGTAGYTAMLCVLAIERHGVAPGSGEVLVTGSTGGVGSIAVALLSKLGHHVTAATGKAAEADYLRSLGASTVIDRAEADRQRQVLAGLEYARFNAADDSYLNPIREMIADQKLNEARAKGDTAAAATAERELQRLRSLREVQP